MCDGVALPLSVETNRVPVNRLLASVVQGIAREDHATAVGTGNANDAIDKLASRDVNALAALQLE